jgi:hypothetical protein
LIDSPEAHLGRVDADAMLKRFSEQAPVAVMARLGMQRAISADWVNQVFEEHSETQYTRELLFSTVVELMSLVALGLRPSLHAAAQKMADLPVSLTALYDKVNRVEPNVVQGKPLANDVRQGIAQESATWQASAARSVRRCSARESARGRGHGQRVRISDVQLWMLREHSVWQQVTQLRLRPSVHNAVNDQVQVGARVDVVRDACGDDREDIARALGAFVEPREEPIATTEN